MPEILLLWALSFLSPENVKINGEPWKIELKRQPNGSMFYAGYTFCDRKVMEVQPYGPEELRDTVMHEVLHALACKGNEGHNELYNNSEPGKRHEHHRGIYWASPRLVRLIRENPELITWMEKR